MGNDWGKVKNCCQTTAGEAWDFPTDDVSETERCASNFAGSVEGDETRTYVRRRRDSGRNDKPAVTVARDGPPDGGRRRKQQQFAVHKRDPTQKISQKLKSNTADFQKLKTSDEFFDMDKLDSVVSAMSNDFQKFATKDLILPFIHDSDISEEESDREKEEHEMLHKEVVAFREGHDKCKSSPSTSESRQNQSVTHVPHSNPHGRRIFSAPLRIRVDSYDSDSVSVKDRQHQFEVLKHKKEVEYWKNQKRKADMQMEHMAKMLTTLQARVDAISPETRNMQTRKSRRHRVQKLLEDHNSEDDFDYSRSHSRQHSPDRHHFKRKKKKKKKRKSNEHRKFTEDSVFHRPNIGGSDLERVGSSDSAHYCEKN